MMLERSRRNRWLRISNWNVSAAANVSCSLWGKRLEDLDNSQPTFSRSMCNSSSLELAPELNIARNYSSCKERIWNSSTESFDGKFRNNSTRSGHDIIISNERRLHNNGEKLSSLTWATAACIDDEHVKLSATPRVIVLKKVFSQTTFFFGASHYRA